MAPIAGEQPPKNALTALLHSLAHDLAQPLTTVHCFFELLAERKSGVAPATPELRNAALQVDRAIALAKGISALARQARPAEDPWLPLDDLLNQTFENFNVLAHTGFLVLERLETGGILITSDPALRDSLVIVLAKLAGQSTNPINITATAGLVDDDHCHLDFSWKTSDSSGVETQTAEAVFARDQNSLRELLEKAGADLIECGDLASVTISAPAIPESGRP
jgi:signal transduction histidine kinase